MNQYTLHGSTFEFRHSVQSFVSPHSNYFFQCENSHRYIISILDVLMINSLQEKSRF